MAGARNEHCTRFEMSKKFAEGQRAQLMFHKVLFADFVNEERSMATWHNGMAVAAVIRPPEPASDASEWLEVEADGFLG
jgi:hypothetical protein